jgi:hypothetical protein
MQLRDRAREGNECDLGRRHELRIYFLDIRSSSREEICVGYRDIGVLYDGAGLSEALLASLALLGFGRLGVRVKALH